MISVTRSLISLSYPCRSTSSLRLVGQEGSDRGSEATHGRRKQVCLILTVFCQSLVNFMSQPMSKRQPLFNSDFRKRSRTSAPMIDMSGGRALLPHQSGENMIDSAIFCNDVGAGDAFPPFLWFTNANRYITNQGRSLDACETRAVAPSPFPVFPDLWGTNRQLLDGPRRRTFARKNSDMESIRQ